MDRAELLERYKKQNPKKYAEKFEQPIVPDEKDLDGDENSEELSSEHSPDSESL